MKNHILPLIIFFCTLTGVFPASSQSNDGQYLFTHLTMDDGLPQNYVEDLMKDSQGFLWISTGGNGITRYDGYQFLTFNTYSQKTKLKNNFVTKFCEDSFGRIWAVGQQGVDILDTKSLKPVKPHELGEKYAAKYFNSATFVYCSSTGNIWMGADNALYKLSFSSDGKVNDIIRICNLYLYHRSLAFCELDGYIWFDHFGTISLVKESITSPQEPAPVPDSMQIPPGAVTLCLFPWQGDIWAGTNAGLFRYNVKSRIVKVYRHDENDPNSLTQDYITDIELTPEGTLAVSSLKGLNLYNAVTDNFTRIQQKEDTEEPSSLNSNFINCLLADEGMLWIGTEVGGLNKMFSSRLYIKNYLHSHEDPQSLSGNIINAILEEKDGSLWIGTIEKGLNLRPAGEKGFIHYTTDAPTRLSHNSVSALASDGNGRIYVGTWGGGFGWLNGKDLSDRAFHHIVSPENPGISQSFVGVLLYDSINRLVWIGSSKEIMVYDPATDKVSDPFRGQRKEDISGSLGGCVTDEGLLWMGTSAGLYSIDLRSYNTGTLRYTLYDKKLDNPSENIVERVTSVYQGNDGTVWIGTNGNGFYQAVSKGSQYEFKAYNSNDGLVSNNVKGIWQDNGGRLWLTTSNGLSCFNPKDESFMNYTRRDGLSTNQFYWNATSGTDDGTLYAGSIKGFSEIRFIPRVEMKTQFPVIFTHLNSFDNELTPTGNTLEIHERDKSLSIEFASLDYNPSNLARYAYRLKGFDEKWISVPANQHSVSYTNLRPGKYVFELRYTPDGTNYQIPPKELHIRVKPYFYKTPWFILLITFIVLGIIYGRFHALKRQQDQLHLMVEERTCELENQKRLLSDQKEELSRQNALLKESNEQITDQKNKILEMSRKVEELTVDKLAFFTNITHEFRTPLTLIVGPIERALKLSYNPQVIEQLQLVERNSKYLLSLINQLMDFRKVEEGRMKIVPNYGNMVRFLNEITPSFTDYAQSREIDFRCLTHLPNPFMLFAEDIMQKIMTNLISNALKFTPKGGKVSIYVASLDTGDGEKIFISVHDTGKGIPEEDISRIFNRFYQSDNQSLESVSGQSGTGIGLYLCRKLVTQLGGEITARNNPTGGSTFRVLLPLTRGCEKDAAEEEHEDSRPELPKSSSKLVMLVVEDNKDMRDYIRSILSEYYNVLEAADGEEALRVLKINDVDFIISDLMMPVMDGTELLRCIRSDFSISHIPFLMLTAKTSDEARLESYKMGVDAYLLKPFDENMLLARISNILENRKRFQQKFAIDMNTDSLEIEEDSGDKRFLERAMKVVKENYRNPDFEVGDFINAMGISKSLLNKKMQSLTGQSAGQFMRNYRLNLARELLLKNKVSRKMNISEIAYEVGFNDPKYFTRCFTKHFNITPSSLLED